MADPKGSDMRREEGCRNQRKINNVVTCNDSDVVICSGGKIGE